MWKKGTNMKPEEFAKTFSQFVNSGFRRCGQEAAVICVNDHPTLQQGMMSFCVAFMEEMAKKEYVDLRNEASRDLARQFIEACPERALPFI